MASGDFSVSMCSSSLCEFNAEAAKEDFSGDVSGVVGRRCTVSPIYTISPVYYVGTLAVLSPHCVSSPSRPPSFLVLVVNWLTRGEVSGTLVVVTPDGKAALGSFHHNLFLTWVVLGSSRR